MHDYIEESSNDARSSYRYEDSYGVYFSYRYENNQFYENVWFLNWFENRLSFEMFSYRFKDRELIRHFKLEISSSLKFESEISLFDSNESHKILFEKEFYWLIIL
jgi:hypothetical protein